MKRALPTLLALLLLVTVAQAQTGHPQIDGAWLKSKLAKYDPTETLVIPPGVYDFGNPQGPIFLPANFKARGAGVNRTKLVSSWGDNANRGCVFEVGAGTTVLSDMTIESDCLPKQQSCTLGWGRSDDIAKKEGPPACASNATLKLYDVNAIGRAFVLYNWGGGPVNGDGNSIYGERVRVKGGRWLVNAGRSTGANAQYFEFHDSVFIGDADLATFGGEIGYRTMALSARGGKIVGYNCKSYLKGNATRTLPDGTVVPGSDDVRSVFIDEKGSNHASIELYNFTSEIIPNGAKRWHDVENTIGTIRMVGGSGSLPDGKFKTIGKVEVTQ